MPEYKVLGTDDILRRVKLPPPDQNENDLIKVLPDGKKQITRLAFRPDPKRDVTGLSVNIIGLAPSVLSLYNKTTHLAVQIAAQECFDLGLTITHDPLPTASDDTNPGYSHALMLDLMGKKSEQATLAERCKIID